MSDLTQDEVLALGKLLDAIERSPRPLSIWFDVNASPGTAPAWTAVLGSSPEDDYPHMGFGSTRLEALTHLCTELGLSGGAR